MLKDNKVPGTSTGTRAAEAPSLGAGSAAGFLGESQAGLCERPGACLDQGGLNRKNFLKRKRENRGTQRLVRELSAAAVASCASTPHPLDCECGSPSTHLKPGWCPPRSTDWALTTETRGGLAPGSVAGCPAHRPKAEDWPGNPINGLVACERPHIKAPVLKNSHLAPVHRALQGLLAL